MSETDQPLTINYIFQLDTGVEKEFKININSKTLDLIPVMREEYPDWTKLEFNKCPNCPLKEEDTPRCPIAVNIIDVIDFFGDILSYEEADIFVTTQERTYFKHVAIQAAVSSLVGIYMVTSGCPIMDKLRPMVRFHLPFASLEETTYRSIAMYLFAQYFLHKQGGSPDWDLKKLGTLYENITLVNQNFCTRLREIGIKDSSLNAIANLDCFAQSITFSIEDLNEQMLDEMGLFFSLFKAYL